jgi:tetratricopeptide (TPR) repeat protein
MVDLDRARQLLHEATPLVAEQRWDEAIPRLEQAVTLLEGGPDPLSLADALSQLGVVRSTAQQTEPALEALARAAEIYRELAIHGREAHMWLVIGTIHAHRPERQPLAEEALQRALVLTEGTTVDPTRSMALSVLGQVQLYASRLEEALDSLTRALAAAPTARHRGLAQTWLGLTALAQGRLSAARQHLAEAEGSDLRLPWGLATLALHRGELDEAERGYRQLLERAPEAAMRQAALLGLAEVHLVAYRLPSAASTLAQALEAGASPAQALELQGRLAYAQGRREAAAEVFEQWAALGDRHRAVALASEAVARLELGQRDTAQLRAAEAEAIAAGHDHPGLRVHVRVRRGLVDLGCDRVAEAAAALAEVAAYLDAQGVAPAADLAVWKYRLELALAR